MLVAIAPFFYVIAVWLQKKNIRDSDRLGRSRGQCLACGYSIAGLEPQDDGCRVCPECGAAWRFGQ